MEQRALKALKGSIRKWEKIVAGTGRDKGGDNCPLCLEFNDRFSQEPVCEGCPVYEKTGKTLCDNSPYDEWLRLVHAPQRQQNPGGFKVENAKEKRAAQKELDFLRSLLPIQQEKFWCVIVQHRNSLPWPVYSSMSYTKRGAIQKFVRDMGLGTWGEAKKQYGATVKKVKIHLDGEKK